MFSKEVMMLDREKVQERDIRGKEYYSSIWNPQALSTPSYHDVGATRDHYETQKANSSLPNCPNCSNHDLGLA